MELTLRQARNVEHRLQNLTIEGETIKVRAYDGTVARTDMESGVSALEQEIGLKLELNDIRHAIKKSINEANMSNGISTLLNLRDSLYCQRDLIASLDEHDDIDRQLSLIDQSPSEYKLVSVYTKELYEHMSEELFNVNRQIAEVSSSISDLNNISSITIDESDAIILQENGIIK